MRRMFVTFVLALSFSTLINAQQQAPLDYQYARTDTIVTSSKTVPGNVWGGSTGMGTKWCNIAYSTPALPAGICIWRLTDATVFPSGPSAQTPDNDAENATAQTDDDQKDNIISVYNGTARYIVVRSTGGKNAIVAFDTTMTNPVTLAGSNPPGELMFDDSNAGIIYARVNHTQIQKYVSTDGWNTYTPTLIYDFANCLPSGYTAKWQGAWGSATTTSLTIGTHHTWGSAFSSIPNQGTGYEATVYKEGINGMGAGCARIDTQADLAYDWNGNLLGPLDDGNGGSLPSFTLHEGGMYRNPAYFGLSPANSCQNCAPAYIWEIGTTHVRPCTLKCDGHAAEGFYDRADHKGNDGFLFLHPLSNPNNTPLIGPLLTDYPVIGYDEHASWLNTSRVSGGVDIFPVLLTTTVAGTNPQQYQYWGEDEIIGVSANPADYFMNVHWRFGQTGNSGLSPNYTCQNAKGTVEEIGTGLVFTSDMASDGSTAPLGTDANGNARCDVFWIELK